MVFCKRDDSYTQHSLKANGSNCCNKEFAGKAKTELPPLSQQGSDISSWGFLLFAIGNIPCYNKAQANLRGCNNSYCTTSDNRKESCWWFKRPEAEQVSWLSCFWQISTCDTTIIFTTSDFSVTTKVLFLINGNRTWIIGWETSVYKTCLFRVLNIRKKEPHLHEKQIDRFNHMFPNMNLA